MVAWLVQRAAAAVELRGEEGRQHPWRTTFVSERQRIAPWALGNRLCMTLRIRTIG
jgi:hypothetical protein